MNHRQRVISAIRHEEVDRVPCDFWAESTSLNRICRWIGYSDLERLLVELDVDIRHIEAIMPADQQHAGFFQNLWGERFVYKESEWGSVREDLPGALSSAESLADMAAFNWPTPDLVDHSNIEELCAKHHEYAIMYGFADIWERPGLVRGLENALMDIVLHPDWVHFLARKFTDFYKEDYSRAFKASKERIDIFAVYSDLGGQNAPLISLEMFNEFISPYLTELVDHIHSMGAYVMFHSCGMVHPFIERFIQIGVDILDPIQPVHDKMGPANLMKEFGGRICFHGGIDIQNILPHGSPQEVWAEVERYMRILSSSGGYICAPSHLFQHDIPPENIFALYEMIQASAPSGISPPNGLKNGSSAARRF